MTVSTRLEAPEDEPFVRALVLEYVTAELRAWDWPQPMRDNLLGIQYTSRRQSARAVYPDAENRLILADGVAVGWFVAARNEDEIYLVDMIVSQAVRSKGIGSSIMRELIAEADQSGRPVRLSVRITNPAVRMYERFGFRRAGGDELSHFMERAAPAE